MILIRKIVKWFTYYSRIRRLEIRFMVCADTASDLYRWKSMPIFQDHIELIDRQIHFNINRAIRCQKFLRI